MQSMAILAVAVSNNLHPHTRKTADGKQVTATSIYRNVEGKLGRRGLGFILSTAALTAEDSRTQLLQKYLKKSEENKARNEKERLDSYYKRNYKDYFGSFEGSLTGKEQGQLSETEKGILDWLQKNK